MTPPPNRARSSLSNVAKPTPSLSNISNLSPGKQGPSAIDEETLTDAARRIARVTIAHYQCEGRKASQKVSAPTPEVPRRSSLTLAWTPPTPPGKRPAAPGGAGPLEPGTARASVSASSAPSGGRLLFTCECLHRGVNHIETQGSSPFQSVPLIEQNSGQIVDTKAVVISVRSGR